MKYTYRVTNTLDPEERLEDAAMAKAMHDVFGDRLEVVPDGNADFGRDKMFSGPRKNIAYWTDPSFMGAASRSITCCSIEEAEAEVSRLHADGKGAFIKSCDLKLFSMTVPVGQSVYEALGDMTWSVLDRPACILVQPHCDVRFEMRFVSVGRQVVTFSPVGYWLTPISTVPRGNLLETPCSREWYYLPPVEKKLHQLAQKVAQECRYDDVIIDCAIIDGEPGVIEFNPFSIGNFGLYACDPHKIATAVFAQIEAGEWPTPTATTAPTRSPWQRA